MVPKFITNLSQSSFIISNLIPLVGVIFFGWKIFDIFFLYWLELCVLVVFLSVKFLLFRKFFDALIAPIFLGGVLYFYFYYFTHYVPFELHSIWFLVINLFVIFISHSISFYNFVSTGVYKTKESKLDVMNFYLTIIPLHLAIFFGGVMLNGLDGFFPLIVFVFSKTILDIFFSSINFEKFSGLFFNSDDLRNPQKWQKFNELKGEMKKEGFYKTFKK